MLLILAPDVSLSHVHFVCFALFVFARRCSVMTLFYIYLNFGAARVASLSVLALITGYIL
jgi:hypothetical protein